MTYTLQILHASDQEAGLAAIERAPNFAAIIDWLEDTYENSITVSGGDNILPSPFFNAGADSALRGVLNEVMNEFYGLPADVDGDGDADSYADLREGLGRVDIAMLNIMGFQASALGNHEYDQGTSVLAELIRQDYRGAELGDDRWMGTLFPYLSANFDFSNDPNLSSLYTDEILPAEDFASGPAESLAGEAPPKIAPATIIEENGEKIGVVGATTQILKDISSPGATEVIGDVENDMAQLASVLQPYVDDLIAQGIDKIVLLTHLQDINLEKELAPLMSGIDVIVAAGSHTLSADGTDRLAPGDTAQDDYPFMTTNADGDPVAIVSTANEYSYVGRLVVTFDDNGVIIPESIDADVSGAYVADEQTVEELWGDTDAAFADGTKGDLVGTLTEAVNELIVAKDGEIYGQTDVFLEGRREAVRTEETNLGNLTADANLAAAREIDDTVQVSLKNGGGIRAPIGEIQVIGTGDPEFLPPSANPEAGKEAGDISQLDLENSLRFNNALSIVTVTAEGLFQILEHAVAGVAEGATPGSFAQVAGVHFSYDPDAEVGSRVQSVALVDQDGIPTQVLVQDGVLVADPAQEIRMVTLGFLADGGDSYPFPELISDRVDMPVAMAEQAAFADYLEENYSETPFDVEDTSMGLDSRIQNLAERSDTVDAPVGTKEIGATLLGVADSGSGEAGSEVSAYDTETMRLFVTNGAEERIDVFDLSDPESPVKIGEMDLSHLDGFGGVTSVATKGGLVAAAVPNADGTANGQIALFDVDGTFLGSFEAGALPDMVTFSPDGTKILSANEGEPVDAGDPKGSVTVVDISGGVDAAVVTQVGFTAFDGMEDDLRAEGVRIFPGKTFSDDVEPEYITVSADGSKAFVTLQEANSVAVLDLTTNEITDILPLGTIDHSVDGFGIDASDRDDAINIATHPVLGMFMPDAIANFTVGGQTYFVTANEGDDRGENERVKDLDLDPDAFPDADALQEDENIGRLNVSSIDGDTDGDGDYDALYTYGTRSFTIFDAEGNLVFDSGDQFEKIIAERHPALFNADNGEFDGRSDNKGPEPEGVTIATIDGQIYAFVGLERDSGIMVYNVTSPADASFVTYIDGLSLDQIGPETLQVVSAEDSPTHKPLLIAANEISGTTAIYELDGAGIEDHVVEGTNGDDVIAGTVGIDDYDGGMGDDVVNGGTRDDVLAGGSDDDIVIGDAGMDAVSFDAAFTDVTITRMSAGDIDLYNRLLSARDVALDTEQAAFKVVGPDGTDVVQAEELRFADATVRIVDGVLVFDAGDDTLTGGTKSDAMAGGAGDDLLDGLRGNDLLVGNAGDDDMFGGAGSDVLVADQGNDNLIGGSEADILVALGIDGASVAMLGGSGADVFAFMAGGPDLGLDVDAIIADLGAEDMINLGGLRTADGAVLSLADVLAVTADDMDGNAVIDLSAFTTADGNGVDGSITLAGVATTDLTAGQFDFAALVVPEGMAFQDVIDPAAMAA
ncbi:choice-of-anchor I family protein [Zavarzinia marina]|uniref:choice-of-anchor I family protein n=1 Tax=Zavarzinia marina TaxID=2911065 RepID=UPI0022A88327|nr:choice-of-anchor I family protein [Zavarzinia marina]